MNIRFARTLLDSKQKRLSFFQNLLLVATADRYFDEKEGDFLLAVGRQLELTPDDVNPIVDNLPVLSFIIPETGLERTLELQAMVMMMTQDGHIDDKEYALCLDYATRIGYGRVFLDDLIQQLTQKQDGSHADDDDETPSAESRNPRASRAS